ncbi:PREDICTED: probable glycosyltransferase At5g03795 [Populus euphratica]|uniref:Probable glycosyltransferase At5g03795 n=1 Tax=Populus euphratica TaxID=75702 RepID=A0AAJ6XLM0_POPEU|nr:PREDICTED: probable glycosyltransferase At5g03795 [Populus euphratica]XP_011023079.1 PREDICTED: probable glycosyltransferase At5g03795 [Populus euphratica]
MQSSNPPQIPANEFLTLRRTLSYLSAVVLSICFSICLPQSPFHLQVLAQPLRDYPRYSDAAELPHIPKAFRMDYMKMERSFKVFVYPHKTTACDKTRKIDGKYGSEGFFYQNLNQSRFLTRDPDKANLFLIPTSCHSLPAKGRSVDERAIAVQHFVNSLISEYPYWNRTLGADHFLITCADIHVTASERIWNLMKNSIRVMCSPSYNVEYVPHKDVSLPQSVQPFNVSVSQIRPPLYAFIAPTTQPSTLPAAKYNMKSRAILGFWRGLKENYIRKSLVDAWENDSELDIKGIQTEASTTEIRRLYHKKFYSSKFCICPGGPQIDGAIAVAIHYGCVPVIMSDYFDLPFNDILDWKKFSVILKESDVDGLKRILLNIPDQEYQALQTNTVMVQDHFQWNLPPVRLDAFHMVMYELWLRRYVTKY